MLASAAVRARRECSPMQLFSQTHLELPVVTVLAFSLLLLAGDVASVVGGGLREKG